MAEPSETTQAGSARVADGRASEDDARDADAGEVLSAIRALATQVGDLQAEVETLRTQSRVLPPGDRTAPGWDEPRRPTPALTWVETIEAPSSRAAAIPRLLLEVIFLVAVAVGAAIAELEPEEIVALMAVAWALVAIAEFAASRADRRRAQAVYGPYPHGGYPSDASWFAPPVERTMLDLTQEESPPPAKLPPPSDD
jgi:hypothetical protein